MQTQNREIILLVIVTTIVVLFLISFIAAVLFLYQKKNILYFKQLEDVKNTYDKNLLQTQLEIQEQTFQDISREIHDNIGLSLTLAKLHLNTIDYSSPATATESIGPAIDLITKAIQDLSDVSKGFNSELIKNNGLYNTLKLEIEKIRRSGKHLIDFIEDGNTAFLDAQKELVLFRIAQEALNNILKHAAASHISIQLKYEKENVKLSIRDNGIGYETTETLKCRPERVSNGLINMRRRTRMLNGIIDIESNIGKGTTITITAPY